MKVATVILTVLSCVVAMEPLYFGITPPSWQAGLPSEIHINYDVPTFGTIRELQELKRAADVHSSYLQAKGSAEIFYESEPLATEYERSYQAIKASLEKAINEDFVQLRNAALGRRSFLGVFPSREPQINLLVDSSRGKFVDVERLRSDIMAFAKAKMESLEADLLRRETSFLQINGDEIPPAEPVVNVHIEEPASGYFDSLRASQQNANERKIASLRNLQYSTQRRMANLLKGK